MTGRVDRNRWGCYTFETPVSKVRILYACLYTQTIIVSYPHCFDRQFNSIFYDPFNSR